MQVNKKKDLMSNKFKKYHFDDSEWWQKTAMLPRIRVTRCIDERPKRTLKIYNSILKASKRKNIK